MKRLRNMSSVHKAVSISIILSVFIVLIIGVSIPNRVYGWGSKHFQLYSLPESYSGHYFIINKAIEYLRRPEVNLLPNWPLEDYMWDIMYGAYWADFPYDPKGLECNWCYVYYTTCDSLHHFLTGGTIHEDSVTGLSIGDGRGLGAPQYASILYDLAIKFWPGGPPVPDISSLPFRDSGGFMCCLGDTKFGPFVVGGASFCIRHDISM